MDLLPAGPADHAELARLYDRHAFAMRDPAWMRWKYEDNPHGRALTFKLIENGALVGAASVQPRTWHHAGEPITGIHLVDGLLGEEVRGRKHFRDLTAFLMQQLPPGTHDRHFHYAVPSVPASVKACANAGLHALGGFVLHTRILDPVVLSRVRGAGWIAPALRPAWRTAQEAWLRAVSNGHSAEEVDHFGEDLTSLSGEDRVHGDRSAAFLAWRVFANPMRTMRAFVVRDRTGRLAGYVVARQADRCLEVMDLHFVGNAKAGLGAFLRLAATRDLCETVDCARLPGHTDHGLLRACGFVPRRSEQGVFYVSGLEAAGLPTDPRKWDVQLLDSDW